MVYLHLPKPFAASPFVTLPADAKRFWSVDVCAADATPAEPSIWRAREVATLPDGSRMMRLLKYLGHARKLQPALPEVPSPSVILAGFA